MKLLSELLAEVEPDLKGTWHKLDNYYAECILPETKNTTSLVTKEDYDKLKAIAVELAKALEFYGTLAIAKKSISDARKMLENE